MKTQNTVLSAILALVILSLMCVFGYFYHQKNTLANKQAMELHQKNQKIDSLRHYANLLEGAVLDVTRATEEYVIMSDSLDRELFSLKNELGHYKGLVTFMTETEIPAMEKQYSDSMLVLSKLKAELALEKKAHKATREKYVTDMSVFQAQIRELETTALNLTADHKFAELVDNLAKAFSREHHKAGRLADSLLFFVVKYPRYLNTSQYDWPENIMEYFQNHGVQFTTDQISPDDEMALLLEAYDKHMQQHNDFAAGKIADTIDALRKKNPDLKHKFADDFANLPTKNGTLGQYLNSPRYQQTKK